MVVPGVRAGGEPTVTNSKNHSIAQSLA
jgi:hypothetical protein